MTNSTSANRRLVLFLFVVAMFFISCVSDSQETKTSAVIPIAKDPVILVHGFGGWGRDDIQGFYYWGGSRDFEEGLRKAGYLVFTASVGPFSSNWDRACELYAFIYGGTVDYGEFHSQK